MPARLLIGIISLILFLCSAQSTQPKKARSNWHDPFPPFRIAGNLYYVGTSGLAAYLIATPEGLILINSNFDPEVPLLRGSVEKLGFRFQDIKIMLDSHAHQDHVGGCRKVKEMTGAQVMVMAPDAEDVRRDSYPHSREGDAVIRPCEVSRVLNDGDQVKLGGMALTAHLTPGHTPGATTWTFPVTEDGKQYNVLIDPSVTVNHPEGLVRNRSYPTIIDDYERAFRVLNSLPCDIYLAAHDSHFGMHAKYQKLGKGPNPFIDPQEAPKYIGAEEKAFRDRLAAERAASPK